MMPSKLHISPFTPVIEAGVPALVEARTLTDRFHSMIRKKVEVDLDSWVADASASRIASFASGINRDRLASTISKREATWIRLMNEGIKGDPSAIRRVFDLARKFGLLKRSLNPQRARGGTIRLRKGHPYLTSNDPKDLAPAIEEHENRFAEQERLERLQDGGS